MASRFLTPFITGRGQMARGGDPFMELHREVNRLFDDVFRGAPTSGVMMRAPALDVDEDERQVRVCAELPGLREEDIELQIENDMLTISGEKRSERQEGEGTNRHLAERSYGRFQRVVQLPFAPDPDGVQAGFENGVLTVTLPKPPQPPSKSRRIEVRGSSGEQGQQIEGQASAAGQQGSGMQAPVGSGGPSGYGQGGGSGGRPGGYGQGGMSGGGMNSPSTPSGDPMHDPGAGTGSR